MKMTTIKNVKDSLETMQFIVTVPQDIAQKARTAVDAMLRYTGALKQPPPSPPQTETEVSIGDQ